VDVFVALGRTLRAAWSSHATSISSVSRAREIETPTRSV
jgi:hypothetical protein